MKFKADDMKVVKCVGCESLIRAVDYKNIKYWVCEKYWVGIGKMKKFKKPIPCWQCKKELGVLECNKRRKRNENND